MHVIFIRHQLKLRPLSVFYHPQNEVWGKVKSIYGEGSLHPFAFFQQFYAQIGGLQ